MTAINITAFGGEAPVIGVRLLPDNYAAAAINTKLLAGELRGIRDLKLVHTFSGPTVYARAQRVYYKATDEEFWIGLSHREADCFQSQLVNDAHGRVYILDPPGSPLRYTTRQRLLDAEPPLLLGVPAPVTAPTVVAAGGTGTTLDRAYVYTFYTVYGEEGPPSLPTTATGHADGTWTISAMDTSVPDQAERAMAGKYIYRTITASTGVSQYYRVASVPMGTDTYVDTIPDSTVIALDVTLDSVNNQPPPIMDGVVPMPGGFVVGWRGTEVYFSRTYLPHAWPVQFYTTTKQPVVAAGYYLNMLVLGTMGYPVMCAVQDPATIQLSDVNTSEPCLGKNTMVSSLEGVYYASPNGLVLANTSGINVVTRPVISRDQWESRYSPQTMCSARHETQYIGLHAPGRGIIIDGVDPRVAVTQIQALGQVEVIWNDRFNGNVYLIADNKVYAWDSLSANPVTYRWRSKEFALAQPVNFGVAYIDSDQFAFEAPPFSAVTPLPPGIGAPIGAPTESPDPPAPGDPPVWQEDIDATLQLPAGVDILLRVYAGRRLVYSQAVSGNTQIRLPSGFKETIWQVEVIARVPIYRIALASTGKDLAGV